MHQRRGGAFRCVTAAVVLSTAIGCGGDETTGPSTSYQSIAGAYAGIVGGVSAGITMTATFSLTITQTQGTLGGSYGITGTLTAGVDTVALRATGTVSGTIDAGEPPPLLLEMMSGLCPSERVPFSGTYDSVNRAITLYGAVPIFESEVDLPITPLASCQWALVYHGPFILSRQQG